MKSTPNTLTQFQNYLTEQNKSPNTIKSYSHDILSYFKFLQSSLQSSLQQSQSQTTTISYSLLNRSDIFSYKQHLKNKNTNAKTINRILSSLKKYNEFLILQNPNQPLTIISSDYIQVQKSFTSPTNVTLKEAIKFINKIKEKEAYRNYAIVITLANVGLRISEVLNIKLNDLNLSENEGTIIGKGNKQRDIIINSVAVNVIKEYITNHRNKSKYADQSEYLFVSNKGVKLQPCTIQRIFNKYSNKITPHQLRHVFATNALESNILDIRQLQCQLGHSRLDTVQIYTHPTKNKMKKSLNMKEACIG